MVLPSFVADDGTVARSSDLPRRLVFVTWRAGSAELPLTHPFADSFADHERGQVRVRARDCRHEARVADAESLDATHAPPPVRRRLRWGRVVRAHGDRATWMVA